MGAAPPEGQGSVTVCVKEVWEGTQSVETEVDIGPQTGVTSKGRADGARKEGIQLLTLPHFPH